MAMQIEELKSRLALLEHVNHGLLRPFLATNPSREGTPKSPVSEGSAKVVPLAHKTKQATEQGARKKAQTQHKGSLNKSADSLLKDMKAIGAKLQRLQQQAQVSTAKSKLSVTPLTAADMTDLMREVEEVRADTKAQPGSSVFSFEHLLSSLCCSANSCCTSQLEKRESEHIAARKAAVDNALSATADCGSTADPTGCEKAHAQVLFLHGTEARKYAWQ
jgi:hypothetical protein